MTRDLSELTWPYRTERLELRPARAEDAEAVWQWRQDPAIAEWISARDFSREEHHARFERRLPREIVALHEGRIVATAKLELQDPWAQDEVAAAAHHTLAEVGWVLDPACQGRGLGTELGRALLELAFDGCGVRRVVASCAADNTASWKLMERIGMRRENHGVADWLHRERGWLDGYGYAILADEWRAQRA